jgi:hypothetical protein
MEHLELFTFTLFTQLPACHHGYCIKTPLLFFWHMICKDLALLLIILYYCLVTQYHYSYLHADHNHYLQFHYPTFTVRERNEYTRADQKYLGQNLL